MNKIIFRLILLSAAATGFAYAADVDFGGVGCGDPFVNTPTFSFSVQPDGILCDTFTFDLPGGGGVTGLTITGDLSASRNPADYTCTTSVFLRCAITVDGLDNLLVFSFLGTDSLHPGFPARGSELLSMRGFAPNQTFTGEVTQTPEPATVLLVLAGLGALALAAQKQASQQKPVPVRTGNPPPR